MTDSAPERTGTPWLGGRRWSAIAAAAVVLLAVTTLVRWWTDDSPQPQPPAAPGVVAPTTGSSRVPGVSVDNGNQAIPTTAPTDVSWQVWHALALPFSTSAGPARVQGQAASGFARTPTGALIAYTQASSRLLGATDDAWREVYTTMIAAGQGRDDAMRKRSTYSVPAPPAPGSFAQFAGFRFISYTSTDAVIQIASRNPQDGTYITGVGHVSWVDGDWKIVLPPKGSPSTKKVVPSLDGFVPWGNI